MSYKKTILCLANSYKTGGRCIAGREVTSAGFGGWIRPISQSPTHEINEFDMRYRTGGVPSLFDHIEITFSNHQPYYFQTENHLIDTSTSWSKTGTADWNTIQQLVETLNVPLWENGSSTIRGLNDKIPESLANKLKSSLMLIKPGRVKICVNNESQYSGGSKLIVRAHFRLSGQDYILKVTDPLALVTYEEHGIGEYALNDAIFCISLSEVFQGYVFKLVATIFTP